MKAHFAILPAFLFASGVLAEERSKPEKKIESTRVIQGKGRTITIQRVEAPPELSPRSRSSRNHRVEVLPPQGITVAKESVSFTVSATVIDGKTTMLEWNSHDEQQKIISFSNMNWELLGGFKKLEDDNRSYTSMIFTRNITRAEFDELNISFPDHLPPIEQGGARYTTVTDGEISPVAADFLEAIHKLYDQDRERIKEAHTEREQKREERELELLENPPKPQDVTLQFWKRKPAQETPAKRNR